MNFLEAKSLVSTLESGKPLAYRLCMAGTAEPLLLFLRGHAALRGCAADIDVLPFGTMNQHVLKGPTDDRAEIFLLLSYDFLPEADPRSGVSESEFGKAVIIARAQELAGRLATRPRARFVYLPAPLMPLSLDPARNRSIASAIHALASSLASEVLDADCFSMASYLANGCPVAGSRLSDVARTIDGLSSNAPEKTAKLLITDLDNTLWGGQAAEIDPAELHAEAEGLGYPHFIYQSMLRKLKTGGVLLAAVSRNDRDVAETPLRAGRMNLREEDFVCIAASYGSKSAHIRQIVETLNLGFDSVVFVDDNEVELAEVKAALPEVEILQFPLANADIPAFINKLGSLFARSTTTAEDRQRTELYRRRLESLPPVGGNAGEIKSFLRGLNMKLTIRDRSNGTRDRAVQLINKTNQFNINGRRISDEEIAAEVDAGSKLFTAELRDRTGDHGEILSLLVTPGGDVSAFVMSCRVFQRQVEFAMLDWLINHGYEKLRFHYVPTKRNTPARNFLNMLGIESGEGPVVADKARLQKSCGDVADLFKFNDQTAQ